MLELVELPDWIDPPLLFLEGLGEFDLVEDDEEDVAKFFELGWLSGVLGDCFLSVFSFSLSVFLSVFLVAL